MEKWELHTGYLFGELKRPLKRNNGRQEDNVEMDLKGVLCDSVNWIRLAQDADWRWAVSIQ
jgi:hypothetical protein